MWCLKRIEKQTKTDDSIKLIMGGAYFDDEELREQLRIMYDDLRVETIGRQKRSHVAWYLNQCRKNKSAYESVATYVGAHLAMKIDWRIVCALHAMEAGFDLKKGIHCGQRWDRKTTLIPKDRGPFASFESSCLDAFKIKRLPERFDIPNTLIFLIAFNGWGYYKKGILASPYCFAYSNYQVPGKYVRDGVYDPGAVSLQVGAAVLLKELQFKGS